MEKSIVIVDDNKELVEEIRGYFSKCGGYRVAGVAYDGLEALGVLEKERPDYLLLDIVMPELDGFGVLSALNCSNIKTTVVMISQLATDGFIAKAIKSGASFFMAKPVNLDKLKEYLDETTDAQNAPVRQTTALGNTPVRDNYRQGARSLEEKIANIFISVGIPAHIKGYTFLREAIKMTIQTPDIINGITKRLYPAIADKYETSPSKVERAIRHAIEVAWNRGKIENINMIFGLKIYNASEKPTNGEFIALIADKICLEGVYTA